MTGTPSRVVVRWRDFWLSRGGARCRSRVPVVAEGASRGHLQRQLSARTFDQRKPMDQRSVLLLGGGTYKGESGLGSGIFPWTLLFGRSSVSFPTSPRCAVLGTCDTPSRPNLPDAALQRRQLMIQQSADSDAPRGPREPKGTFASFVYAQTKAEQAPAQQNRQGPHICRTGSSGLRLMRRTRGLCPCPQRAGRRRRGQS